MIELGPYFGTHDPETYCPGCGCAVSSYQHGWGCPENPSDPEDEDA